jgi:putative membrane protein insertion efficiency factor
MNKMRDQGVSHKFSQSLMSSQYYRKTPPPLNKIALWLISFYQKITPPLPTQCVYLPTCSGYAEEAFKRHSFFKALKMVLLRLLRCHPLAKGGYDPVKEWTKN